MYKSYVDDVIQDLQEAQELALAAIGYLVQNNARLQAAVDTGRLRQSIEHVIESKSVHIGSTVDYAVYLEYGTRYMNEQPFLTPAFMNNLREIQKIVEDEYGRINNKS